jgi:hypothetical protein
MICTDVGIASEVASALKIGVPFPPSMQYADYAGRRGSDMKLGETQEGVLT